MMHEDFFAVILAGGGGTRLWPVSRKARPKQLIRFFDEISMFQTAVRRLDGLFPPERIFVVSVAEQVNELQGQCPELPKENFIIEPMPRGTASAIGLAAVVIGRSQPEAVIAVLTSDHYIKHEEYFRQVLSTAREVACENFLVTLGITPSYPATGYGYIHSGESLGEWDGIGVYQVAGFREKPDLVTAERFLAQGGYAWNSGMFIMKVKRYLEEVRSQMPDLYRSLREVESSEKFPRLDAAGSGVWRDLRSQTIDYGIMEGAHKVALIPAGGLGWNDVGSWDSFFETRPVDKNGNIFANCEPLALETSNTLVFDDSQERLIVTLGVDDLVIVETKDVLLVCRRDQGQKIRGIVEGLKSSGREEFL